MEIRKAIETPEGRAALAAGMTQPVRCGGLDYVDGQPMYAHEKRRLATIPVGQLPDDLRLQGFVECPDCAAILLVRPNPDGSYTLTHVQHRI